VYGGAFPDFEAMKMPSMIDRPRCIAFADTKDRRSMDSYSVPWNRPAGCLDKGGGALPTFEFR
jgi:hypothetical protein